MCTHVSLTHTLNGDVRTMKLREHVTQCLVDLGLTVVNHLRNTHTHTHVYPPLCTQKHAMQLYLQLWMRALARACARMCVARRVGLGEGGINRHRHRLPNVCVCVCQSYLKLGHE